MQPLKITVTEESELSPLWMKVILWLESNVGDVQKVQADLFVQGAGWQMAHHVSFAGVHSLHIQITDPACELVAALALL